MTMLSDRRLHPRFKLDIEVALALESGGQLHRFQTRSLDIARGGMQVKGRRSLMELFEAQKEYPPVCRLAFTLPGEDRGITVKCHKVTHRRLSQNEFYISLHFVEFEDEGQVVLENYLSVLRAGDGRRVEAQQVQRQKQQRMQQA